MNPIFEVIIHPEIAHNYKLCADFLVQAGLNTQAETFRWVFNKRYVDQSNNDQKQQFSGEDLQSSEKSSW